MRLQPTVLQRLQAVALGHRNDRRFGLRLPKIRGMRCVEPDGHTDGDDPEQEHEVLSIIVIKRATHALTPFGPRSFHEVHDGVFDNINIDSCRSQI